MNFSRSNQYKDEVENSKYKVILRYSPQYYDDEEEETEEEYSKNATPGPGYYSVNGSTFFQKKQTNLNASFGTKVSRFNY